MFARHLVVALAIAATLVVAPAPLPAPAPLVYSADGVAVAHAMAASGYGEMASGRHFLAFDSTGDGRVVEAVGDLATARRIVILVPGNDTTLGNFDRGLGGVSRRAPAVQARVVYQAIHDRGGAVGVAVIAWLGYDSPEGMGMATIREERAQAGAAELQRFVASLPAAATVVVVGHSYGSTVVGLAAPGLDLLGRPAVTDLVALASPGMGVPDAAGLHTRARVWAGTSGQDWIRLVPHVKIAGFGHGTDPTDPEFGARPLPTDKVTGHDSYLVPGSTALAALTRIVLTGQT